MHAKLRWTTSDHPRVQRGLELAQVQALRFCRCGQHDHARAGHGRGHRHGSRQAQGRRRVHRRRGPHDGGRAQDCHRHHRRSGQAPRQHGGGRGHRPPRRPRRCLLQLLYEDRPRRRGADRERLSPGAAAQSGRRERHRVLPSAHPGQAADRRFRHCVSPDHARAQLCVPDSLSLLREIRHPPLWLPRHEPQVVESPRCGVPRQEPPRPQDGHLPYRLRRKPGRHRPRHLHGYDHGLHPARRRHDGHALRQRRPRHYHRDHGEGKPLRCGYGRHPQPRVRLARRLRQHGRPAQAQGERRGGR